jgi:hypothetical protein
MTKVLQLADDGTFREVEIVDTDSVSYINCGGAITDPLPLVLDCGGAT